MTHVDLALPAPIVRASCRLVEVSRDAAVPRRDETSRETAALTAGDAAPWPLASVVKLPWMLAVHRLAAAGELDLERPLRLDPATRTPGPTGVSALSGPVEVTLRDAAYLALTQSDNACADAVWDAVGAPALQAGVAALGVPDAARHPIRRLYEDLRRRPPSAGPHADARSAIEDLRVPPQDLAVLDPARGNVATAAQLADLLVRARREADAADPAARTVLASLGEALLPGRIRRGLTSADVQVTSKTGTLLHLRHDAGLVEFPGGTTYALVLLTAADSLHAPAAHDAAVARLAADLVAAART